MKSKNVAVNRTFFLLVFAFFFALLSYAIYSFVTGFHSFAALDKWDGVTVAESFASGNGTEENPYVIQSAEEFVYFQSLIEGDNYEAYQDKYYALGADIDFNDHALTPIGTVIDNEGAPSEERIFKGVLDGKGYSLRNFKITEPKVIRNMKYYTLFTKIEDGSIYRMNLDLYRVDTTEDSDVVVSLLAGVLKKGTLENIGFTKFELNSEESENASIGVIAAESDEESTFKNIYVSGKVRADQKLNYFDKGTASNFITELDFNGEFEQKLDDFYVLKEGKIYLGEEEISSEELLTSLNEGFEDECYWSFEDGFFVFSTHELDEKEELPQDAQAFSFSILNSADIVLHDTGTDTTNGIVYINDLDADYNYYIGRNYTEIRNTNGTIPSGSDQGLYSDSNLATVYIRYSSADINDSSIYGTVSVSEKFTDFYYYKRYPVVNGYVEFDLIDNPWARRPDGRAFNGWVTDYNGAVVSLDIETYTRKVRIPVSNVSSPISITFYSSWTIATTVTSTGDLGDLKSATMQQVPKVATVDLRNYYILETIDYYDRYPNMNGLYDLDGASITGNSRCWNDTCQYLTRVTENIYDSSASYYTVVPNENANATVTRFFPTTRAFSYYTNGSVAGYFKYSTDATGNTYDANGKPKTNCGGSCYQLLQYSDGVIDNNSTYYYLTTRDTNIFIPSNATVNSSDISTAKPMTITGIDSNNDYSNNRSITITNNRDWTMQSDIRIEYVRLYSNTTNTNVLDVSDSYGILGNFHNMKIGRGIKRNGSYLTAATFAGGSNSSVTSVKKYTLIVESGWYQVGSGVGYNMAYAHHVNGKAIIGCDIDRINEDNDNLIVYYNYAGSWGSNLYSGSGNENTYDVPAIYSIIKSGDFGSNDADYAAGVYAGGLVNGTHYALRELTVEGGHINNLIGGPMTSTGRAKKNDIIINVKGGDINIIFGGAGAAGTVGNRILNVTGGTVRYSILGGSNAYFGTADGKVDGDTLVYVGGNVTVGNQTNTVFGVSSGNVFGAGNGRSNSTVVGSVNNSNVIIGPTAKITGSVYGGGNYGAVGGSLAGNTDVEEEEEETVDGDVYEDGTVDNNIRYYGANPENYIRFDGQNYRIIGLFNNVSTSNGNKNLVRIMSNSNIGNHAWANTDAYSRNSNTRYNIYNYFVRTNDTKSEIYNYLNSDYYNDLSATDKNYIQSVNWSFGSTNNTGSPANTFYNAERGGTTSTQSMTPLTANIGLFYASDYGFASSGSGCLSTNLSNYGNACDQSNWMSSIINSNTWTMTPSGNYETSTRYQGWTAINYYGYRIFYINANDSLAYQGVYTYQAGYRHAAVYPSFYLKDDVTISGGTGTADDPYIIGESELKLTDIVYKRMHPDPVEEPDPGAYTGLEDDGVYQEASDYQCRTHVHVIGGTITGSVYGAGNNNGSGNLTGTKVALSKITIDIDGGTVGESVYGGSNEKGTVYGDVLINANNGKVNGSIYGGGKGGYQNATNYGTYVSRDVDVNIGSASTTNLQILQNVYGGSAFGSVNGTSQDNDTNSNHVRVTVNAGTITGDVFGGGQGSTTYTPYEFGNVFVHINGGNMSRVFGGNDSNGEPSSGDVVYLNGGTIGNAFGGGNNTGQDSTDIRLQGSTITGNLYGGSNQSGNVNTSHVIVTTGSVVDIYGGNNLDGRTTTTNVIFRGADIEGDIYGGGNQADSTTTNVIIYGGTINDVYGGGNQAGVSNSTNVSVISGSIDHLFGGSNRSGDVGDTHITVSDSYINRGYTSSEIVTPNLHLNDTVQTWSTTFRSVEFRPSIENISDVDYPEWTAVITAPGSSLFNGFNYLHSEITFGDGTYTFTHVNKYDSNLPFVLKKGEVTEIPGYFTIQVPIDEPCEIKFELFVTSESGEHDYFVENYVDSVKVVDLNKGINYIYGGNNLGGSTNSSTINVTAGTIGEIYGGGKQVGITTTTVNANGGEILSIFGGSNQSGEVTTSNVHIGTNDSGTASVGSVYGGNNAGGVTSQTHVTMRSGNVETIYGGGNQANVGSTHVVVEGGNPVDVYGGGNAASVLNNSILDINGGVIANNAYGGGNEGTIQGNTNVTITNATVEGNAFAGGNGATAIVHGNSVITIDGDTVIGTESTIAPNGGCVFGSGNAAATGLNGGSSKSIVNIVGGKIYGNVYGGPKMSVVYGTAEVNIGTSAVSDISGLVEDDIVIHGTVFGGGESNTSGGEAYDYTAISVTNGITVNINGTGYIDHNHDFVLQGSIFGSGNASSSSGESIINIKNLGSKEKPNQAISIQRATNLVIDSSVVELFGTTDRTNEYSDLLYSLNLIDKMIIKNNTILFLQHNANMLKEFYSGVDQGGELVKATVDIDDDTKTVTKNVDNRLYMKSNEYLNVTVTQNAQSYGRVSGMTFLGMYLPQDDGSYRLGLYDSQYTYGSSANAGLEIVGGSYVNGLHADNHDITKDGFYSNTLDEDTFSEIVTAYIDPEELGTKGYRWIVGFETLNYETSLTISKYASMGTSSLTIDEFAKGDTTFKVIGINTTEFDPDTQLINPDNIPRIANTEEEANSVLGLAMKMETQEWATYGSTKVLSANGGDYIGDNLFITDSRKLSPTFMFYSYHAKNYTNEGQLGDVVIMMQVEIPRNAIEVDIKFITITVHIDAKNFDDVPSYDASITYDKKYEMPANTLVNITNQSQFTAYFSLNETYNTFTDVYGENNVNYHALTVLNPLPVGTIITMLDFGANDNRPDYYYYTITQADYDASVAEKASKGEASYRLSKFIKMDSTSSGNTYNDAIANMHYYDEDSHMVDEEFIFIIDMKDTANRPASLNNHISFELRRADGWPVINVLYIRDAVMNFSTFESSNIVLSQEITNADEYLYHNVADEYHYATQVLYNQTENNESVIDTNYEYSSMGLNIVFFDNTGAVVSSSLLAGTNITIGNQEYYADGGGVFRIKLANKVSTIDREATLVPGKVLPAGDYTIRYTLFASEDGLHNSTFSNSVSKTINVTVVPDDSYIAVECDDEAKLVYGETGLNHAGDDTNTYLVKYNALLTHPNYRVEVYKRSTTDVNTTAYVSVPFSKLFTNEFSSVGTGNEVRLPITESGEQSFDFSLADDLESGTYRVVFKIYDNNQLIDEDMKYVIVQKKID